MKLILFILISILALTATLSGLLLMNAPDGSLLNLPVALLDGTGFKDFMIPGLLLTITVGAVNLLAVFLNIQRHPKRYDWALIGGAMTCGFIIGQMILLHTANWLHLIFMGVGILIILLAYQLKGKWVV
jgi:hypothetical protein